MLETCLKRSLWEPPYIDTLYVEYEFGSQSDNKQEIYVLRRLG